MKDEMKGFIVGAIGCFMLGAAVTAAVIESKQHTGKSGCEYVEQAPCKIIYIKDDK